MSLPKIIEIRPAVMLRPETYRRLAEYAALGNDDVSDEADEIITNYLNEEDELEEQQCPLCHHDGPA